MGFDTVQLGPSIAPLQVQHWRGIRDALEANGIEVRRAPAERNGSLMRRHMRATPNRS